MNVRNLKFSCMIFVVEWSMRPQAKKNHKLIALTSYKLISINRSISDDTKLHIRQKKKPSEHLPVFNEYWCIFENIFHSMAWHFSFFALICYFCHWTLFVWFEWSGSWRNFGNDDIFSKYLYGWFQCGKIGDKHCTFHCKSYPIFFADVSLIIYGSWKNLPIK